MTIIVANGAYRDTIESDISKLFSDLQESDPGKMKVPVLREAMERLKGRDSEMMSEYDRIMRSIRMDMKEEFLEEGKAAGLKEGLAEGRADIARNMIRESFPPERIAQLTGLSQDDVRRIAAEMAED